MRFRPSLSLLLAIPGALVLGGCDTASNLLSAGNSNSGVASGDASKQLQSPDLDTRTPLGLIRDGALVRVGDDVDTAMQAFPAPQKGSFPVKDLPKRIPNPPYKGLGWSTSTAGFGVVSLNHRVALAMITELEPDEDHVKTVEETYQHANQGLPGSTPAAGDNRYFFWESGHQRLMIFEQLRSDKQVMLTIALGDKALMDVIQAAPTTAIQDLKSVQTQLQPQTKDGGKPPASKPADPDPHGTTPISSGPPLAKPTTGEQKTTTAPTPAATSSTISNTPSKEVNTSGAEQRSNH